MSIAEQIQRIQGASADIKAAIESYGVTVNPTDTYAEKIGQISGGEWLPSADTVLATFARRQSGGQGPATIEKIYGKTIVWNQRMASGDTLSVDNSEGTSVVVRHSVDADRTRVPNHKYLCATNFNGQATSDTVIYMGYLNAEITNLIPGPAILSSLNTSSEMKFGIYVRVPAGGSIQGTITPVAIDLTLMFGEGNEPSTVDEFLALFPDALTAAYDAGSLLPVKAEKIVTRGVNQWDEEWEVGAIDASTGANTLSTHQIRAKGFIPVSALTKYYIKNPVVAIDNNYSMRYYDADKTYIGSLDADGNIVYNGNRGFKTPANTAYIRFVAPVIYGTTYNDDICINLFDPAINGQYFPYRSSDVGLPILKYFPTGLRGVGDSYDEIGPKKKVQRRAVVDLGSLEWSRTPSDILYATIPDMLYKKSMGLGITVDTPMLLCPAYTYTGSQSNASQTEKTLAIHTSIDRIQILDSAYTDATTFKAAMSGVMLDYPLADPIVTDIDEQMTYLPDEGGTEEVSPITAPFSADIRYARLLNEE